MDAYDIITKIGKGSSGSVFLARNSKQKSKLVAIKKIEIDDSRKSRSRKSVTREANILRTLNHFHIVKCQEWFLTGQDAMMCMVLEYCDGGTIQDRIKTAQLQQQPLPENRVLTWTTQITSAVCYIHERRILHRDLKSENVFLLKSGDVKLGDFGISKEIDHTLDKASTCVGTPCYLSPELCQDIPYSFKSDIWALGCLVFEMLALAPAFDAANLVSLFYKIVNCKYAVLPNTCSSAAKDFIAKVLTRDPGKRPTAEELLKLPILQKYSTKLRIRSPELTAGFVDTSTAAAPVFHEEMNHNELDDLDELLNSIEVDDLMDMPPSKPVSGSNGTDTKRSFSVYGDYTAEKAAVDDAEDDLENNRPQTCPHSARTVVLSTLDSVATWSGYGDRGSHHTSGKHHRLNLSSSSDESDHEKIYTQRSRDYSSDDFSTSSDEESKLNTTAGDDEIPEVIEVAEDYDQLSSAINSPGKMVDISNVTPVQTRNLPGSAWLLSKRAQVLRRKQDDVRQSLPVIVSTVQRVQPSDSRLSLNPEMRRRDSQNNNKAHKSTLQPIKNRKERLPGSSWLKRESRPEEVVLGNPGLRRNSLEKKKRLPGSGWLLNKKDTHMFGDNTAPKADNASKSMVEEHPKIGQNVSDEYQDDNNMNNDDDYADDFEDDSDPSDNSDFDETATMTNMKPVSSLLLVQQDCIDTIGEDMYNRIKALFKQGFSIGDVYEKCKSKVDFETLETCYVLLS